MVRPTAALLKLVVIRPATKRVPQVTYGLPKKVEPEIHYYRQTLRIAHRLAKRWQEPYIYYYVRLAAARHVQCSVFEKVRDILSTEPLTAKDRKARPTLRQAEVSRFQRLRAMLSTVTRAELGHVEPMHKLLKCAYARLGLLRKFAISSLLPSTVIANYDWEPSAGLLKLARSPITSPSLRQPTGFKDPLRLRSGEEFRPDAQPRRETKEEIIARDDLIRLLYRELPYGKSLGLKTRVRRIRNREDATAVLQEVIDLGILPEEKERVARSLIPKMCSVSDVSVFEKSRKQVIVKKELRVLSQTVNIPLPSDIVNRIEDHTRRLTLAAEQEREESRDRFHKPAIGTDGAKEDSDPGIETVDAREDSEPGIETVDAREDSEPGIETDDARKQSEVPFVLHRITYQKSGNKLLKAIRKMVAKYKTGETLYVSIPPDPTARHPHVRRPVLPDISLLSYSDAQAPEFARTSRPPDMKGPLHPSSKFYSRASRRAWLAVLQVTPIISAQKPPESLDEFLTHRPSESSESKVEAAAQESTVAVKEEESTPTAAEEEESTAAAKEEESTLAAAEEEESTAAAKEEEEESTVAANEESKAASTSSELASISASASASSSSSQLDSSPSHKLPPHLEPQPLQTEWKPLWGTRSRYPTDHLHPILRQYDRQESLKSIEEEQRQYLARKQKFKTESWWLGEKVDHMRERWRRAQSQLQRPQGKFIGIRSRSSINLSQAFLSSAKQDSELGLGEEEPSSSSREPKKSSKTAKEEEASENSLSDEAGKSAEGEGEGAASASGSGSGAASGQEGQPLEIYFSPLLTSSAPAHKASFKMKRARFASEKFVSAEEADWARRILQDENEIY